MNPIITKYVSIISLTIIAIAVCILIGYNLRKTETIYVTLPQDTLKLHTDSIAYYEGKIQTIFIKGDETIKNIYLIPVDSLLPRIYSRAKQFEDSDTSGYFKNSINSNRKGLRLSGSILRIEDTTKAVAGRCF